MAATQIEVVLLNGAVVLERSEWATAPTHLRALGEHAELVIKTQAAWSVLPVSVQRRTRDVPLSRDGCLMILRQARATSRVVPRQRSTSNYQRSRREVHSRPEKANAPPSDDVPLPGRPPVQYRRSACLVVGALGRCGTQPRQALVGLLTQAGISEPSIKRHFRRLEAEGVIVAVAVDGDRRRFYELAVASAVAA